MSLSLSLSVAVIVPAYKSAATLIVALESIRLQTSPPSEVWIVDDASPQQDAIVAERYIAEHRLPHWGCLKLSANVGAGSARDVGVRRTSADLVAFLDADDAWHPDHLWKAVEAVSQSRLDVFGAAVVSKFPLDADDCKQRAVRLISLSDMLVRNRLLTSTVVLRREIYLRAGGFEPGRRYSEDYLLWLKICVLPGVRIGVTASAHAVYRTQRSAAAGLSSRLWAMERSELSNLHWLWRESHIRSGCFVLASALSIVKFVRRAVAGALESLVPTRESAPVAVECDPLHICFSANQAWNIYNFRRGLLQRLLKDGARISVLAPRDECSDLLRSLGCEVVDIELQPQGINPVNDLRLFFRYRALFKEMRPDLAITYTIKPNIFGVIAAWSVDLPTLAVTTGLGYTFINRTLVAAIARQLYRWSFRTPLQVWFLNEDDRSAFVDRGLVDPRRAVVLDGEGVDLEHYRPSTRSDFGPSTRFLLIARMLWDKGVREYAEAAAQLRSEFPDVEFAALGPLGVDNPSAVSSAQMQEWQQQGLIRYLGTSDDVRPFVADADCVVLPSYREGIPRTLMEAAAMGRPLIATDVPGCREVVIEGLNGLLCRPRDATDLARAIRQMILTAPAQRARMGAESRAVVAARFDERLIIERYRTFLREFGFTSGARRR